MHERVAVNTLCFQGASLQQIFDNWRELAPGRVSMTSNYLLGDDHPAVRDEIGTRGYRVETITHGFVFGKPIVDRDNWGAARDALSLLIERLSAIGGRSIYMLTGGHGDAIWEEAAEAFSEAVAPCIAPAKAAGVALVVEPAPIFFADMHIAHTLRDTLLLAEMADIGVCIDIFPSWPEAGLKATIDRAAPRCAVVQVGDYVLGDRSSPCRAAAGDGIIPLDRIINWIEDAGFSGGYDLELLGPRIDAMGQVNAARQTADAIGAILDARG